MGIPFGDAEGAEHAEKKAGTVRHRDAETQRNPK
jgi:hypothetical protein